MAESVPDQIDVETVVISVTIVEESIGEAVSEHMRMSVIWVTTTELTALVVPERPYIAHCGVACRTQSERSGHDGTSHLPPTAECPMREWESRHKERQLSRDWRFCAE